MNALSRNVTPHIDWKFRSRSAASARPTRCGSLPRGWSNVGISEESLVAVTFKDRAFKAKPIASARKRVEGEQHAGRSNVWIVLDVCLLQKRHNGTQKFNRRGPLCARGEAGDAVDGSQPASRPYRREYGAGFVK